MTGKRPSLLTASEIRAEITKAARELAYRQSQFDLCDEEHIRNDSQENTVRRAMAFDALDAAKKSFEAVLCDLIDEGEGE